MGGASGSKPAAGGRGGKAQASSGSQGRQESLEDIGIKLKRSDIVDEATLKESFETKTFLRGFKSAELIERITNHLPTVHAKFPSIDRISGDGRKGLVSLFILIGDHLGWPAIHPGQESYKRFHKIQEQGSSARPCGEEEEAEEAAAEPAEEAEEEEEVKKKGKGAGKPTGRSMPPPPPPTRTAKPPAAAPSASGAGSSKKRPAGDEGEKPPRKRSPRKVQGASAEAAEIERDAPSTPAASAASGPASAASQGSPAASPRGAPAGSDSQAQDAAADPQPKEDAGDRGGAPGPSGTMVLVDQEEKNMLERFRKEKEDKLRAEARAGKPKDPTGSAQQASGVNAAAPSELESVENAPDDA
eukprot:tig00020539_g10394.t1